MNINIALSKRLVVTLALLAVLLVVALLASGLILHAAHLTPTHLFADSSTPDVIIHNH